MLKILDNYYDINLIDIIYELKAQLSEKHIYLFSKIKELPEDIMVSCPFHKEGQENRPSCGIRKEDGWLHCFTCNESCSLQEMISRCFGYDDLGVYGLTWLKNNFIGELSNNRSIILDVDRNPVKTESHKEYIQENELDKYRYYHPYMFKRKMNEKVINIFDIGYDKKTNSLTFPVRDKDGNCLFVARRHVHYKQFSYPGGALKPIYGIYELYQLREFPKEIYICESMIDCIYLWTFNKYAIALNGLGTKHQIEQLNSLPCRKYILATDNDEAGKQARINLKNRIKNKIITEVELPPNVKDINDCTEEEILNLKEIY